MDPANNKTWINYVRTQVKIEKDGFELCPDTSQNGKIWISLCPFVDPAKNKIWINYVRTLRTQVKITKDGFDLCPDTS